MTAFFSGGWLNSLTWTIRLHENPLGISNKRSMAPNRKAIDDQLDRRSRRKEIHIYIYMYAQQLSTVGSCVFSRWERKRRRCLLRWKLSGQLFSAMADDSSGWARWYRCRWISNMSRFKRQERRIGLQQHQIVGYAAAARANHSRLNDRGKI